MSKDGRVASDQALAVPAKPASGLGAARFDPSRVREADSDNYGCGFYGILNNVGQFWTILVFDTPDKAFAYIRRFWSGETPAWCRRNFRIVPVRIKLNAIAIEAAQAGETHSGSTGTAKARAEGIAQTPATNPDEKDVK